MRRTPRRWRIGLGTAALVLVSARHRRRRNLAVAGPRLRAANAAPTVNWALAGSATATATTANPPSRVERN